MTVTSQTHQLPEELWTALLQAPAQQLHFQQGPFQVEVRIMPLRAKPSATAMLTPQPKAKMPSKQQPSSDLTELALEPLPPPPSLVEMEEEDLSQRPAIAKPLQPVSKPEPVLPKTPIDRKMSDALPPLELEPPMTPVPPSASSLSMETAKVLSSLTPPPPSRTPTPPPPSVSKPAMPMPLPQAGPVTPPPASQSSTGLSPMSLGPSSGVQTELSPGNLSVGGPSSQRAPDLSTHASIQRIPTKMKTADWKKLIGEPVSASDLIEPANVSDLIDVEKPVPNLPEDATMMEVPSLGALKRRREALQANAPDSDELRLLDFESDLSVEEIQTVKQAVEPSEEDIPVMIGQAIEEPEPQTEASQDNWSVELDLDEIARKTSGHYTGTEWQKQSSMVFRLLRSSDTTPALETLFKRDATSVKTLDTMFKDLPPHHPSPSEFAEASGVSKVLKELVPFCYEGESTPTYRVVGRCSDNSFVLLFQQTDSRGLVFMPLDVEGQLPQIALVEGENLLNETELTELFQTGARSASPEEAKAKARQVQQKLGPTAQPAVQKLQARQANFEPPSTASRNNENGLDKSIVVDQRLLNRFEFHRNHNSELWDEDLQPGIAVFSNNSATLFIENRQVTEGVLLCLLNQGQYLVFDRRTKRSVHLQPNANQRLWLRKEDEAVV
ncbi:MAG: hypothetical protein EP343_22700 [Deltaproteobacteria bacterium]|nr:MAG: hypothetical protein EP343_22700 [Deltaproteobacteria bacterium]